MRKPAPEQKHRPELVLVDHLLNFDLDIGVDERVAHLQTLRRGNEVNGQIDRVLIDRVLSLRAGLDAAQQMQSRLKETMDRLTATPWFPGIFLGTCETPEGIRAMVQIGNTRRVVRLLHSLEQTALSIGDEVFLGAELNVIVAKSPNTTPRGGDTAVFTEKTHDGRLILRQHDEEIVLDFTAESLKEVELSPGDLVRFDRAAWLACERIRQSSSANLFLQETPDVTFDEIGGLDSEIEQITRAVDLHLLHQDIATEYRLRRKGSVLLVGPSGTGKTMTAKALANWLGKRSSSGRSRFMNIKPSELHSMWYSQSEANYREAFRVAREAALREPGVVIVMFFDEVDAIGLSRGHPNGHVDDRILTAFMTELNGLAERGNILVVAATNRRSALDPALIRPGRLGDLVLEIPRPKRKAARDIFSKHLRLDIPFARNGYGDDTAANREEILEAAVSRIYAPNGDNELATLQFRDGKRRSVRASDLISGAIIASIANNAVERACVRQITTGERGLRFEDVVEAMDREFDAAIRVLTPANCRQHLTDLPQDMDVVSVTPILRKTRAVAAEVRRRM